MSKVMKYIISSALILFLSFISYVIWDNYRIKVVKQEVVIKNLPKEFEGYQILQITDLHEKEFGKNQQRLLKKIKALDTDIIVFTGDMLENRESTNFQPFYTLLENIHEEKPVLVVPGNDDAPSYQYSPKFAKSEFVKGMEERGAIFLEAMSTVEKNKEKLHFVNLELAIIENPDHIGKTNGSFQAKFPANKDYQTYQKELWEPMIKGDSVQDSDVVIALNHFPIPDIRVDYIETDSNTAWRNFDLVIAGHYHGGQIRIPFFGALFIPDPWYEPNSFFPPQDRVQGLWEYKGTQQYVSAGLGSSDAIPFLKFRMFTPPEINVLTLTNK